ncbi:hypothetical protein PIB30_026926 [Stylosanthes scabra]|uniref:SCP domain-containing protein n=1 Tax=Stylosanthes scabra TaxID=79078 RepID=A0ABU6XAL6_9FABA|nr:hypothetical protein [Stylosanthes scabra]
MERMHILISFVSILLFRFCLFVESSSSAEYLKIHNDERAIVGVKFLIWDPQLESLAQTFVHNHLVNCMEGEKVKVSRGLGQNIGRIFKDFAGVDAVKVWVDTKQYYDYASNTCIGGGNNPNVCFWYLRIVAKKSTRLGCASAICHNNKDRLVTCYYYPRGTFIGERPY